MTTPDIDWRASDTHHLEVPRWWAMQMPDGSIWQRVPDGQRWGEWQRVEGMSSWQAFLAQRLS